MDKKDTLDAPQEHNNKMPLEETIRFLAINIGDFCTVDQWAKAVGYSPGYFSRRIKEVYDVQPSVLYQRIKLIEILLFFAACPGQKARDIARKTSFRHEKALGEFLARHANVSIPEIWQMMESGTWGTLCRDAETEDVV